MAETVDKSKILYSIFHNDRQIDFDVTEEVLLLANFLGSHPDILRSVYKSYRRLEPRFDYKPKIGAPIAVIFDYEEGQRGATFQRQEISLQLTEAQFLIFMAKIDAVYSAILPVGTVVELDEEMLPQVIRDQLAYSGVSELVVLAGRKIPLQPPFDRYIVDYHAHLWPIGQLPNVAPIFVSNMMIRRVVHLGLEHPLDATFALDVLQATQLAKEQISTAYMPVEEGIAYYEKYQPIAFPASDGEEVS